MRDEVQLLRKFRLGLQSGAIEPHYQPEIDLHRPDWMGFEALSRWHDPDWGDISPGVFIPLAEKQGLLADLTIAQIHQLSQDAPALVQAFGQVSLAFNLSPHLIGHAGVWAALTQALKTSVALKLSWEIELTENEAIADFGSALAQLAPLRRLGAKVVLDDFGTGWSNWSRAEMLQADGIKIDSMFVRTLASPQVQTMLGQIADQARAMGMGVTVEGVETSEQETLLRQLGLTRFQGWLYAKAMPLHELLVPDATFKNRL